MRRTIKTYVFQYAFAVALFFVVMCIERALLIWGASLWFLAYLIKRKVSFKIIFLLGMIVDLASNRVVGATGIFLSLLLMFNFGNWGKNRFVFWVLTAIGIALLVIWDMTALTLPLGFFLGAVFSLPLFVLNLRGMNFLTAKERKSI